MKVKKREQGFTLVELLVGMLVFLLILGGTAVLLASSVKSQLYCTNKLQENQQGKKALNQIAKELENAAQITLPAPAASGGKLTYIKEGQTCDIFLGSGGQSRTLLLVKGGKAVPLTDNVVKQILFTRSGINGRVTAIQMVLNRSGEPGEQDFILETQVFSANL